MALLNKNLAQIVSDTENILNKSFSTIEEQRAAFNEYTANILYTNKSLYDKIKILKGSPTVPDQYNLFFETSMKRIESIFNRINDLNEKFNQGVSGIELEANLITQETKTARSLLNILSLYNKINDNNIFYFADSFLNLEKSNQSIETGLVSSVYIDTEAGVVTLPRSNINKLISPSTQYSILSGSTLGAKFKDNKTLSKAFDTNIDDWAEYYFDSSVNTLSLKLVLLITLDTQTAINQIKIEPTNFGTSNWLKINHIKVSTDNITYKEIQEIDNQFVNAGVRSSLDPELLLSNYEQKFTKIGSFLFEPVQTKYVILEFEQREPIKINDSTYRYLIGIRNLEINQIEYSTRGTFYSSKFERDAVDKEIGSISLNYTSNLDYSSEVGKIRFYVSHNSVDWYPITALDDNAGNEIVIYNQPWLENNNDLDIPVEELYIKIDFENNINELTTIPEKIIVTKEYTEIAPLSTTFPYDSTLTNDPNEESLQILTFPFGSVGKDTNILIKENLSTERSYIIEVPFALSGEEKIFIGDRTLYHSDSPGIFTIEAPYGNFSVFSDTVSVKNVTNVELNSNTFTTISIYLKPDTEDDEVIYWWEGEDVYLSTNSVPVQVEKATTEEALKYIRLQDAHVVRLRHFCDGIKKNISVFRVYMVLNGDGEYERQYEEFGYIIPKNTLRFKIDPLMVKPLGEENGGLQMIDAFEVPFIDGIKELMNTENHIFSVNYATGDVYRKYPTTEEISARCYREIKTKITDDEWELMPLNDGVILADSAYEPGAFYEVLYNIAISIDTTYVNVEENTITLNDYGKVTSYLDGINSYDRLVRFTYLYNETAEDPILQLANYFSPILKDYTLTCTGLQF